MINSLRESLIFRRSVGFIWHALGIVVCYYLAFQIRLDFDSKSGYFQEFYPSLPLVVFYFLGCIFIFRLYEGLWRFFTFRDCLITAIAFLMGTLGVGVTIYFWKGASYEGYPRSVLLVNYLLILGWEIGGRGVVRLFKEWRIDRAKEVTKTKQSRVRTLIIGEPEEADSLIRSIVRQSDTLGDVVAIVTERRRNQGGKMHGISIIGGQEDIGDLVIAKQITRVIFLPPSISPQKIREVMGKIGERKISCDYRVVPSVDDIAAGKVETNAIRKVAIEDLLHREPYVIDEERMRDTIEGVSVMVTGAGGSIGSEICRQIVNLSPSSLVLFEISEFNLFEIERELCIQAQKKGVRLLAVAGDVRRESQVRSAIRAAGGVSIIYHAAAYKHVDLMERNSTACLRNNVLGTQVAATIAEEEGVESFVLISSDKAVRPTSLMGASKRLAERVIIERAESSTRFKAVRFGNVLGSSGSVVPIFREQIAKGGPVTVTSEAVTRYFMTIPEAVELVLAASAVGDDRRILVLEMGEPVRIDSLARRMIELSGFVPDQDIMIEYIGLKSGEKEYEELLTEDEGVVRTVHDRIWVVERDGVSDAPPVIIDQLVEIIEGEDPWAIRKYVHSLVPGSRIVTAEEVR